MEQKGIPRNEVDVPGTNGAAMSKPSRSDQYVEAPTQGSTGLIMVTKPIATASPAQNEGEVMQATKFLGESELWSHNIDSASSGQNTKQEMCTIADSQKTLFADIKLQVDLISKAMRSGCDDEQERELLANFVCEMQLSMDTYNEKVGRRTGLSTVAAEIERPDDFGRTSMKSTVSTIPGKHRAANDATVLGQGFEYTLFPLV
jgi:hypothetical protein